MIRQDYLMRLVQQLAEALARVAFLRRQGRTAEALREVDRAFGQVWGFTEGEPLLLEPLIAKCREEDVAVTEQLVGLADLLRERGDLLALERQPELGRQSQAFALGVYLEVLLSQVVSLDLIAKAEALIASLPVDQLPPEVRRRLLAYYEARGQFAKAEDVLFEWVELEPWAAAREGFRLYGRLAARPDAELERGNLPRAELEEGRRELLNRVGVPPE